MAFHMTRATRKAIVQVSEETPSPLLLEAANEMLGPQLAEELEPVFKKAKIEEAIEKAMVEEAMVEEAKVEEAMVEEAKVEEAMVEEAKVEEAKDHETFKAVQAFLPPAPLDGVQRVADAEDLERVRLWLGGAAIDPRVYDTESESVDSDKTWVIGDEGVVGYDLDPAVLLVEQARLAKMRA